MAEAIIDGRGSGNLVGVNEDNEMLVSASISATAEVENVVKVLAPHTGSMGLVGGAFNGSAAPLIMDAGSFLQIAGSISSMPSVTATNESVAEIAGTHTGSAAVVAGNFNGSAAAMIMQAGSDLRVVQLGSVEVFQTTAADLVVDIGEIGSVAITGDVVVHAGSVQLYDSSTGSVHNIGSIEVYGQGTLGSMQFVGSIETFGTSVTVGSEAVITAGSVEVYGPTGSIHTIGSRQVYGQNTLGSVHNIGSIGVFGLTGSLHTIGSTQVYGQNTLGSVHNIGSIEVHGDLTSTNASVKAEGTPDAGSSTLIGATYNGSQVSLIATAGSELLIGALGSIEIWQQTATNLEVNATQVTDPWIVLGSVNVGSVHNIGSIEVHGQNTLGSVHNIGSLEVYGTLTSTNASVKAEGTPDAGSNTLIGATYNGSQVSLIASAGSELLIRALGSIEAFQTTAGDMTVDIGAIGSVAVTGDVVVHAGSVQLFDSSTGSVHNIGSIEIFGELPTGSVHTIGSTQVYGQNTLGSVHNIGSIEIYGTLTSTNASVKKDLSAVTGSSTVVAGNFNGSVAPLLMQAGSDLRTVQLGSVEIFQTTAADLVVDIGQIGSVAITGDVVVQAGSVQLYDSSTGSVHNVGSIEVFGLTGSLHTIGSTQIYGPTGSIHNIGSIEIFGALTATNDSVAKPGTVGLGSVTMLGGVSGGLAMPLLTTAGSILQVDLPNQGSTAFVTVTAGSIEVYGPTGSLHTIGSTQVYGPTGSIHNIGSIEIFGELPTGSVHNIGSLEIFQTTAADMVVDIGNIGSVRTAGGIGSIRLAAVASDLSDPIPVEQARGVFDVSGTTYHGSFTGSNLLTPGAGSVLFLKGFTASAETATNFGLDFSGGTNTRIGEWHVPNSGTIAMNMLGMEPSGAVDQPLMINLFNAGSIHLTAFTKDST